ncbi:MAG: NADH-quinone oxidoreductase subunit N [Candidatus Brocadiae bacterium]|nr:NADH-quinone oxidoreductase subunit N [Candidatus Brocadiia bacterium]
MELGVVDNLAYLTPEFILTATLAGVITLDLARPKGASGAISKLAATGIGAALIMVLITFFELEYRQLTRVFLFADSFVVDPFSLFFKTVAGVCSFLVALFAARMRRVEAHGTGEFYSLLLVTTIGVFLMSSAVDLVGLVVAIETLSIPSYVLAGFYKRDRGSSEAALKYVLYGAVATGTMLMGLSFLYGLAGDTTFAGIARAMNSGNVDILSLSIILGLVLVGVGFKISAAPFHMWTPDVYEGSPTPVTAYLATASKAAGFAVLLRLFYNILARPEGSPTGQWLPIGDAGWTQLVAVISVLTMTIGNLAAYRQTNVKRLLAYSSIAHAGYILLGFVVLHGLGIMAMLFYIAVYVFMNLGAFLSIIAVSEAGGGEEISDFRGLGWRSPFLGLCLSAFLFSLTGLPPFAGFVGKAYLFAALVKNGWIWLAVIAALNSAVSLYYYVRVVKAMYLEGIPRNENDVVPLRIGGYFGILLFVCLVPTIVLGIYWQPLQKLAMHSSGVNTTQGPGLPR